MARNRPGLTACPVSPSSLQSTIPGNIGRTIRLWTSALQARSDVSRNRASRPVDVTVGAVSTGSVRIRHTGCGPHLVILKHVGRQSVKRIVLECSARIAERKSQGNPSPRSRLFLLAFPIIAAAEILFEPHVQAYEKVAAAHLLDLQLGLARAAIPPRDRNDRPRIATHNHL